MSNLGILIKCNLINNLNINKINKRFNKKGKIGIGALIIIVYLVILALVTLYMLNFGNIFHMTGNDNYLFLLGIVLSSLMIFISTLGQANAYIFKTKDYEALSSMPIKTRTIVISKIISLYLQNLVFSFTIMVAMVISYSILSGFSFKYFFEYLIYSVFTPMFPIAASSLIAYLFGFIPINRKARNYIITALYLLFIAGFFFLYFRLINNGGDSDKAQIQGLFDGMSKAYFLARIGYHGMFDIKNYLFFIAISVAAFMFFIVVASLGYNSFNNKQFIGKRKKEYKLSDSNRKTNSTLITLYKKELRNYFNLPAYIINTIVGPLLSVMATVIVIINISRLKGMFEDSVVSAIDINNFLMAIVSLSVIFCLSLVTTTASSISLEGKAFWIVKSSPINAKDVLKSKTLLNNTLYLPFAIIDIVLAFILIKPDFYIAIIWLFIVSLFVIGNSIIGLLCNLLFPRFDFDNPARAVKQSGAVLLNMGISFPLSLIVFGLALAFIIIFGSLIGSIVILVVAIIFMVVAKILINTVGIKKYNRL